MYFDPMYLLFVAIPGMLLIGWAQFQVKGTYQKYAQVESSLGMTGKQVAEAILNKMGVQDVKVEPIPGELSDHYDPSAKAVRLSEGIYGSRSIAAATIAAHECGHVLQDVKGYKPMNIRASLVPAANIGSQLGPILVIGGLVLGLSPIFVNIGIALFLAAILFHVVTLPVEFDASNRALRIIDDLNILQGEEHKAAKKILSAAAFTYVATAISALLQLAYYFMLSRRQEN
ncbi:peptidase membrane zinc metallopeptidase [Thalassoporum mexicanum PCC 7367]|uniref:zinc metallopeptidase n=1 Tax=Thalassoporum mexicanum TaxID=3457544 RepID=UPI00029FF72B|nr:zinc metallopeptidase [Pseudanabaena sp. PCC 7367]AFY71756.1 peptidase membrane zinc metallopeptidase [Pseudanabaena sp. PCC 7367]